MHTTLIGMILASILSAACSTSPLKVSAKAKPTDPWQEYETRTISDVRGFKPVDQPNQLSRYGGTLAIREKATGFFHTAFVQNRWWLIDPDGYAMIHIGVASLTPVEGETTQRALQQKYGTTPNWAEQQTQRLRELGFNGAGAWSETNALAKVSQPLSYTLIWDFMSHYGKKRGGIYEQPGHMGYPNDLIFVFDPEFEQFCDQYAKKLLQTKDDPHLVGHFTDNELPFPADSLNRYLHGAQQDPGYLAAKAWLKKYRSGVNENADITQQEQDAFLEFMAARYFEITAKAIHKYDPNHLILGARFHRSRELKTPFLMRAAGPFVDVISVNYYRVWTPDADDMKNWVKWAGKPFLITEWYAKGEDSGLANTSGAGWIVKTQKDRGLFYQNFTLALLQSPGCIGWHWFKYMDNDPNRTEPVELSNKDANKGIVSVEFSEYRDLVEKAAQVNWNVYSLLGGL